MTAVAVLENVTFVHGDKIQYVIIVFDDEYIYQVSQKILVFRYFELYVTNIPLRYMGEV